MQDPESAVSTADNVRFEYETPESTQALNQNAPLPPTNNPSPDGVGYLSTSLLDRIAWESNTGAEKQQDLHSTGVALISPGQKWTIVEEEDFKVNNRNLATHAPPPTGTSTPTPPPQAKAKSTASRCAPCRFAGVPQVRTFFKSCYPIITY
jgi:subtilisin family serine protease